MFFDKKKIENFETISFDHLIVKVEINHIEIILNRANKKNALNSKMIEELAMCTDYANSNDSIRAVIYKSIGDTFCAGLDLNDFKESENTIQIADIFNKLYKPKLVVLEGNVYAGGLLIVACANHVISKKGVKLSLPEVKRGLFPFQVMDSLLRIMPERIVIDWCTKGKTLDVEYCQKYNLVQEIEESNITLNINKWIDQITKMSPNAIKSGLKAYEELYIDDEKIQKLNIELRELKNSNDFLEGIKAFNEKRNPKWK